VSNRKIIRLPRIKTWDIFDTVLGLKCGTKERMFEILEMKFGVRGFALARMNAELELSKKGIKYSLADIYREFYSEFREERVNNELINAMVEIEYDEIKNNVFIIKSIASLVGKNDILVDDGYLNGNQIKKLLKYVGFNATENIITIQYGKSRYTLWKYLNKYYKILMHTGDNIIEDIDSPSVNGIRAFRVNTELTAEEREIGNTSIEQAWLARYRRLIGDPAPPDKLPIKICAVSAVYNDSDNLPLFFKSLDGLTHKIEYHIFVTNNCTDGTDDLIDEYLKTHLGRRISYNVHKEFVSKQRDPYAPTAIAWQRGLREARKMFKEDLSWTHVLYLDSDIFIHTPTAIENAVKRKKHIVAAPYLRYFPWGMHLASVFKVNDDLIEYYPHLEGYRGTMEYLDDVKFDLMRVMCSSNGFCLYDRQIILDERVNYFPIYTKAFGDNAYGNTSPEYGYQRQADLLGYVVWMDGSIQLEHSMLPKHRPHMLDDTANRDDNNKYVDFKYFK
jgi:hypothetical protein